MSAQFQRIDYSTKSYFIHALAVKDRVNLSNLSELPQPGIINVHELPLDYKIKQLIVILMSRYYSFSCSFIILFFWILGYVYTYPFSGIQRLNE